MWIILPTKQCDCPSCVMLRQVVNEDGTLPIRRPEGVILSSEEYAAFLKSGGAVLGTPKTGA